MASSGTIIGSKSGTRPFLELDWSILNQEVNNNRSRVRLTLYLRVTHSSIGYSARYTGRLQGASFTSSSGYISTSGRFRLTQRDIWVNHNSNGSKTETFTADYNLNMTWGGTYYGNITLSGTGTLDSIPRASELKSFSIKYSLQVGTENTIDYNVDRKSGSFRHMIELRDGSYVIERWDNVSSDGASTLTLTGSKVNVMLNRMANSTSKSFTLRVATRSGHNGGWIGSAVTRNATAHVHTSVSPSASGMSTSISGSGRDKAINKYVQSVTRVSASFSGSAGYGAHVSNYRIQVRRVSGGANSQSINGNSGTTTNPVALSGTYEAIGTVTDSRNRTATSRSTFTVEAYSPPSITSFTAVRNATTATTVNTTRSGTHTPLGGNNTLSIYVQRRTGTGAWSNLTSPTSTSSSFTGNYNSTGNNIALSYGFRLLIRDTFGNEDSEIVGVSTQRVVLDIHKNEGVGIGKIRERGVLDVDGEAYVRGVLTAQIDDEGSALRVQSDLTNGHGYVGYFGSDNRRKGYVGFGSTNNNHFNITNENSGGDIRFVTNTGQIRVDWDYVVEHGSNNNGIWIRFYDGTQICWRENFPVNGYINSNVLRSRWTYPAGFLNDSGQQNGRTAVFVTKNEYTGAAGLRDTSEGSLSASSNNYADIYLMTRGGDMQSGWSQGVRVLAIGRWK